MQPLPRQSFGPCNRKCQTVNRLPCHFGPGLSACLACFEFTGLAVVHFCSPFLPSLAPFRVMLAVTPLPHGIGLQGYVFSVASHPAVVSRAWTDRLLVREHQDPLTLLSWINDLNDIVSHGTLSNGM